LYFCVYLALIGIGDVLHNKYESNSTASTIQMTLFNSIGIHRNRSTMYVLHNLMMLPFEDIRAAVFALLESVAGQSWVNKIQFCMFSLVCLLNVCIYYVFICSVLFRVFR
jgi:hypothetical protein